MWTTKETAEALKLLDDQALGSITKNMAYRWLVMIPKGAGQVGKTVLGPFTHSRNFFSGAVTAVANGNVLISVALAHGFTVIFLIYIFGNISGAHVNPAITFAIYIAKKIIKL